MLEISKGINSYCDEQKLGSALEAPQTYAFYTKDYDLYNLTAKYFYHLAKSHAFSDGNKRTALVVGLLFLDLNKQDPIVPDFKTLPVLIEGLVDESRSQEEVSEYLRNHFT